MTRYALMHGDVVATVVEQDHLPMIPGEWVELPIGGPGFVRVGDAFVPPAEAAPVRHITEFAFRNRFSDAEAIAIDLASIGATVEAASVRRYLSKVTAARYIDLDLDETRGGLQALEGAGLLAAGRASVILDTAIQPGELP